MPVPPTDRQICILFLDKFSCIQYALPLCGQRCNILIVHPRRIPAQVSPSPPTASVDSLPHQRLFLPNVIRTIYHLLLLPVSNRGFDLLPLFLCLIIEVLDLELELIDFCLMLLLSVIKLNLKAVILRW